MTEDRYNELADKYMKRTLETMEAHKVPFSMTLTDSLAEIICDCIIESGESPFHFELAKLEQKVDTSSLDGKAHFYWNVFAGFTSKEAAEEYRAAISDESGIFAVLTNGRPDDETAIYLNDL